MIYLKWLFLLAIWIGGVSAAEHRHAGKHVHGEGTLNIAVEGNTAVVELRAPAESIYGFEHEAKTATDKKKQEAGLATLRSRIHEIVILDAGLGCKFAPTKVAVVEEGHGHGHSKGTHSHGHKSGSKEHAEKKTAEHREVHSEFSVACEKPLSGSTVRFGFHKVFPNLEELKIQVLGDSKQTGASVRRDKGSVKL